MFVEAGYLSKILVRVKSHARARGYPRVTASVSRSALLGKRLSEKRVRSFRIIRAPSSGLTYQTPFSLTFLKPEYQLL